MSAPVRLVRALGPSGQWRDEEWATTRSYGNLTEAVLTWEQVYRRAVFCEFSNGAKAWVRLK